MQSEYGANQSLQPTPRSRRTAVEFSTLASQRIRNVCFSAPRLVQQLIGRERRGVFRIVTDPAMGS